MNAQRGRRCDGCLTQKQAADGSKKRQGEGKRAQRFMASLQGLILVQNLQQSTVENESKDLDLSRDTRE